MVIEMIWRLKLWRKHINILYLIYNILILSKHSILPEDGAITPENVDLCISQQESRKAEHANPFLK